MKRSLVALSLAWVACTPPEQTAEQDGAWVRRSLDHATHFAIEERHAERRLTVLGAGGVGDTLAVYHLGAAQGALPQRLSRLAVVSTTHLAYLHALQALDVVVGAAHLRRIVDPELMQTIEGRVPDIGTADGLDRERLVALHPEAVLDYPFGQGSRMALPAGVPRIAITEYLEGHPLGRAEWIRFFGVLVGREAAADSLYAMIAARYGGQRHAATNTVPVFFGSAWQGRWYAPPGNSYMAALLKDAGGAYTLAYRKGGENIALDLETVAAHAMQAWHVGAILEYDGPVDARRLAGGDPRIAALEAVVKGGFVGNSAHSDLFGKALLEPDVVLRDLRCILHPATCADHVPTYFAPIAQ